MYSQQVRVSALMCASPDFETRNLLHWEKLECPFKLQLRRDKRESQPALPLKAQATPDLIARDFAHEVGLLHHKAWANSDPTVRNPLLERAG